MPSPGQPGVFLLVGLLSPHKSWLRRAAGQAGAAGGNGHAGPRFLGAGPTLMAIEWRGDPCPCLAP